MHEKAEQVWPLLCLSVANGNRKGVFPKSSLRFDLCARVPLNL